MAKKKKIIQRAKLPRNTVKWNLNGTRAEVLARYKAAQAHFSYWLFCQSPFRIHTGNHILYTTPASGTFYYAVTYLGRYVVFVIVARSFWLVGFYNEHGIFQMIWENRLYMDDPDTVLTGFNGNHARISGSSIEQTTLATSAVRKGHTAISDYRGPTQHPEPEGFRSGIGRFVTLIMESKYAEIFRSCCRSIAGDISPKRLGGDGAASYEVHHWSSNSKHALLNVDQGHKTAQDLEDTLDILNELSVLQLDAYNKGIFMHDPLPPMPRDDTWERIDDGIGDRLVGRPQARRGRCGAPTTAHRNAVIKNTHGVQKKRAGLRGGGAGGGSEAPRWFVEWSQGEGLEENKACNLAVQESRAMGLEVLETALFVKKKSQSDGTNRNDAMDSAEDKNQSKALPVPGSCNDEKAEHAPIISGSKTSAREGPVESGLKELGGLCFGNGNGSEENTEHPSINSGSKTTACENPVETDLKELQGPCFVSDSNIDRFFTHLNDYFGDDDGSIEFVPASLSHLLAHGGGAGSLQFDLRSPQFTVFTVNNNAINIYGQGEGTHWSLLVFDNSGDFPRCIHHDSLGGANSSAAQDLADAIRELVPNTQQDIVEASTPRQRNGWDCAIFVMAMARSIARWWHSEDQGDWIARIHHEVSSPSVAALRRQLAEILQGNMSFADLENDQV